jgi:hypothetical protein
MNAPTIPLSSKRVDTFRPEVLEGTDLACTVMIKIPTPSERHSMAARMFELGLRAVSLETQRATQISELYKIRWYEHLEQVPLDLVDVLGAIPDGEQRSEQLAAWNDEVADTLAQKLDDFWFKSQAEEQQWQLWLEQEAERIRDEAGGAPERKPAAMPERTITPRLRSEIRMLTDFQTDLCPAYTKILSRNIQFGQHNDILLFRMHVLGIEGDAWPEDAPRLEFDKNDLVTLESCDAVRELVGEDAWKEIVRRCDRPFRLPETERKNSESLLGKPSDPTGSPGPSAESVSSDGKSTGSLTTLAPTVVSATTIDSSSALPSDSAASATADASNGPTAEAG